MPFYSAGQDHVHHDLVLVAGFSQRKSVLLLYGWCLLLNGLALAMSSAPRAAIVVLGLAAAAATASMARLLLRYRARDSRPVGQRPAGRGHDPPAAPRRDGRRRCSEPRRRRGSGDTVGR